MPNGQHDKIADATGAQSDDPQTANPVLSVQRGMRLLLGLVAFVSLAALGFFAFTTYGEARRQIEQTLVATAAQATIPLNILFNDIVGALNGITLEEWTPVPRNGHKRHNVFFDRDGMPVGIAVPRNIYEPAVERARVSDGPMISGVFLRGKEWRAIVMQARRGAGGGIRGFVGIEFSIDLIHGWWRTLDTPPNTVLTIHSSAGGTWIRHLFATHENSMVADPALESGLQAAIGKPNAAHSGRASVVAGIGRIESGSEDRLFVWRNLDLLGLTLAVNTSAGQIFTAWRQLHLVSFLILLAVILTAICLVAAIGANLVRETRRRAASSNLLRAVSDNLPVLIAYLDAEKRFQFINATGAVWCAGTETEIIGKSIMDFHDADDCRKLEPHLEGVLAGKNQIFDNSLRYGDGAIRDVRMTFVPHFLNGGEPVGFFVLAEDLTEQKKAEEAMRQAQKMNALGQLTGGIAHDFNNMLTAVLGNLEILTMRLRPADENLMKFAAAAVDAAQRGTSLTRRLLAFARKQPLLPAAIDLNHMVEDTAGLLKRTLGSTIEIVVVRGDRLWPCTADPSQVENLVLNLAINARDAMPDGGTLTIEAGNIVVDEADITAGRDLKPGEYVMLAISDTGTGIADDVLENIFDPFFTTKSADHGTGLGLSMVYGFVKQSGGDIAVESVVRKGTTMRVYLPRAPEGTKPVRASAMAEDSEKYRGQETILLADDDDMVRATAEVILSGLGYRVLEAPDGPTALTFLEADPEIALLFTDIIMSGGMDGFALAAAARRHRPDLRLVFATGHARDFDALVDGEFRDCALLTKPYRLHELGRQIREALDAV